MLGWHLLAGRAEPLYRFQDQGRIDAVGVVFLGGGRTPSPAARVLLDAGNSRDDVSWTLEPVGTGTLSGVLESSNDAAGLEITLWTGSTEEVLAGDGVQVGSTVTDATGRFRVLAIPAGDYQLMATRSAAASASSECCVFERVAITSDDTPIRVSLTDGAGLTGTVRRSSSGGPPIDVRNAELRLQRLLWPGSSPVASRRLSVDATGRFSATGLQPGTYKVTAIPPEGWFIASITSAGRPLPGDLLRVDGSDAKLVVSLIDHLTTIRGVVTTDAPREVGSAVVLLVPTDRVLWSDDEQRRLRLVVADVSGYVIDGVPTGNYRLLALPARLLPENWRRPELLRAFLAQSDAVTIEPTDVNVVRNLIARAR